METLSSKSRIRKDAGVRVEAFSMPAVSPRMPRLPKEEPGDAQPDERILRQEVLEEARQQAELILSRAKEEAAALKEEALKQAGQEADRLSREAYEQGFQKGMAEGQRQAQSQGEERTREALEEMDRALKEALTGIEKAKEECLQRYLGELLDCAVAVAEKVIRVSLRSSGEIMKKMILSAAENLKQSAWVKIYLSKSDYSAMVKVDADVAGKLSVLSSHIRFVVMDQEGGGVCLMETPDEILDASVSTQMEHIREILGGAKP